MAIQLAGNTVIHDNQNVQVSGVTTASSFVGDGSQLTNLPGGGGTLEATASGTLADGSKVIVNTDLTLLNHSELDNIFSSIINHWIDDYNHSVYKSMEASGIIYSLKNTELRNNILKLYSGQFSDLSDAINYNLNVIKKLDDIMNRDFELRDNKRRLAMLLNWDNPINIAQFQNNIEFRNLVITSRNIKLWVLREINETIKEVKFSQKEIIKYLNDN